ncbi:MAG: proline iminopeptidase-family hydrolase [Candidatus Lokiarchaeota archaeon]|nr:proline iminopeptidase-family hydrolase [Candidatus Lokiarchaeota archaeon]
MSDYFDNTGRDDILAGGIRMIPIQTHVGEFKIWTKRVGNNPRIKVLLLHGGPGATHELFESFDSFFPRAGIEYYYYDQLGSYYSDQPQDDTLWELDRFVEEVEQVRKALNLDQSNLYLFGLSWGGILAVEYALKYQSNLKGLIISNMMMSCPEYGKYAKEVLGPKMPPEVLSEILEMEAKEDFENPRYMELLIPNYYVKHILRMPYDERPDPVVRAFKHINNDIYTSLQGPSEFGVSGKIAKWDRTQDLDKINVPTLIIGATYDSMDPKHMKWVASQIKRSQFLLCNGSHLTLFDDQENYFSGLIKFIKRVDQGEF